MTFFLIIYYRLLYITILDYSRVEVAADAEKTGKAGKTTSEKPGKDMLIY